MKGSKELGQRNDWFDLDLRLMLGCQQRLSVDRGGGVGSEGKVVRPPLQLLPFLVALLVYLPACLSHLAYSSEMVVFPSLVKGGPVGSVHGPEVPSALMKCCCAPGPICP